MAEVVKARRFEVVDVAGKPWAMLASHPLAPMGLDGSPGLFLYDAAGEQRAVLLLTKEGNPYLKLADRAGTSRAVLRATSLEAVKTEEVRTGSESSLVLFDKDGKVMWKAP